ncbi:hypothetical protein ABPG74_012701 [Tetrahymena malaccensis]
MSTNNNQTNANSNSNQARLQDKKRTQAAQPRNQPRRQEQKNQKLPDEMEKEVKDAFYFYDPDKLGQINRTQLRSILGNFAFTSMNVKEIEEEIRKDYPSNKTSFSLEEVLSIISKKWFFGGGREQEANEIFKLFDRKGKNGVNLQDIKNLFGQYLDIVISDSDIIEFIQEADTDHDGILDKNDFCSKLGYI